MFLIIFLCCAKIDLTLIALCIYLAVALGATVNAQQHLIHFMEIS